MVQVWRFRDGHLKGPVSYQIDSVLFIVLKKALIGSNSTVPFFFPCVDINTYSTPIFENPVYELDRASNANKVRHSNLVLS